MFDIHIYDETVFRFVIFKAAKENPFLMFVFVFVHFESQLYGGKAKETTPQICFPKRMRFVFSEFLFEENSEKLKPLRKSEQNSAIHNCGFSHRSNQMKL